MKNEGARPRGVRIDDKVDEERRREATRGRRHEATMGGRHEATRGRRHEATRGGRHEATRGRDEVAVSGCTLSQSDSKKASCHIERVGFSQVQLVSVGFSQVQLVSVGFSWFQLVSVGVGRLPRRCRSVGGGFAGAVGRLGAASQALVPIPPSVAAALQSRFLPPSGTISRRGVAVAVGISVVVGFSVVGERASSLGDPIGHVGGWWKAVGGVGGWWKDGLHRLSDETRHWTPDDL